MNEQVPEKARKASYDSSPGTPSLSESHIDAIVPSLAALKRETSLTFKQIHETDNQFLFNRSFFVIVLPPIEYLIMRHVVSVLSRDTDVGLFTYPEKGLSRTNQQQKARLLLSYGHINPFRQKSN